MLTSVCASCVPTQQAQINCCAVLEDNEAGINSIPILPAVGVEQWSRDRKDNTVKTRNTVDFI